MGLVPEAARAAAEERMVDQVLREHDGHIATGIFGTKYLLESLAEAGRADVAYEIVNQKTFPGWGYMLEMGATTLWEHWELSEDVYSHNHPMFGSVITSIGARPRRSRTEPRRLKINPCSRWVVARS